MKTKPILIVLLILLSVFISNCKPQPKSNNNITITFISGDVKINDQIASTGIEVKNNDVITTGLKSIAVIQFHDKALVTIQSNSYLKIISANSSDSGNYELYQEHGTLFNKIQKGTKFSIKTPTIIAAVRGTSFEIKHDSHGKESNCSVLNGIVSVSKLKTDEANTSQTIEPQLSGEEVSVNEGYQVTYKNDKIETPVLLDEAQKNKLSKLDNISFTDKHSGSGEFTTTTGSPIISDQLIEELNNVEISMVSTSVSDIPVIEKPVDPKIIYREKLEDIKIQNNGKLDKITLRDGQVIMGMITERGSLYKIVTPDGTLEIQPKDIESQTITH